MSTYYNFYIGYKTSDNKVHAFGAYDKDHKLRPVLCKSRSFISDLYHEFYKLNIDDLDEELQKKFVYNDTFTNTDRCNLHYLPVNELPGTNFIKTGFFLGEEVTECIKSDYYEPYFSERYTENEYTILLSNAFRNDDKEELDRLKKFMYFGYPDYNSKEHESYLLHQFIGWNGPFSDYDIKEHCKDHDEDLKEIIILMNIN